MKLLKSTWKRGLAYAMVAMLSVGLLAGCGGTTTPDEQEPDPTPSVSENKEINIGVVNWAECVAVSNLWKEILEQKDYTVNLTTLEVAPLFVGLNKGDLDVFMDAWLPITHQTYWKEYKDNLDDYGIWYQSDAKIGLVVPNYVDLKSIGDLKDNKDDFDGKIIGIDPGAGIMKASAKANDNYELGFEVVQSSEAAMMTALDKAYRNEEAVVVTGWSPHWMFAKYDLKYLDDPKQDFGDAEKLHILANKDFTTSNPEVADMLKAFKLTDKQIGDIEGLINEGMEPQKAAKAWMKDNQDVVDGWI